MSAVWVVAGKDLRQRIRDRSALMAGVVAPLALAGLISLAFGRGEVGFDARVAVVDLDGGPAARAFVDDVLGAPELTDVLWVRPVATEADAERLARDGDVDAALVVPPGFTTALGGPTPLDLAVIRAAGSPLAGDVLAALAEGFAARLEGARIGVAAAAGALGTGDPADLGRLQAAALAQPVAVAVAEEGVTAEPPSAGTIFAPAMAVFFVWFVAGLGAQAFLTERQQGTLARMLAAPVAARAVLGGKALATFTLCCCTLAVMVVASTLVLGADWGNPLGVAVLVATLAASVTAVTALVLTVARTRQQVALGMAIVTFGFALLGGNFVNLSGAPPLLQSLALLTPNGWALRGFSDLAADGGGLATVSSPVAAIAAFGVLAAAATLARAGRWRT
jgi:ABC-2 type transport system permease protein